MALSNPEMIMAAAVLSRNDPTAWGKLLDGLQDMVNVANQALLNASPNDILAMQGRCYSLTVLLNGLKTARTDAEKLSAPAKR